MEARRIRLIRLACDAREARRGHIVDDWDRRMCEKYLSYFMQERQISQTKTD